MSEWKEVYLCKFRLLLCDQKLLVILGNGQDKTRVKTLFEYIKEETLLCFEELECETIFFNEEP